MRGSVNSGLGWACAEESMRTEGSVKYGVSPGPLGGCVAEHRGSTADTWAGERWWGCHSINGRQPFSPSSPESPVEFPLLLTHPSFLFLPFLSPKSSRAM